MNEEGCLKAVLLEFQRKSTYQMRCEGQQLLKERERRGRESCPLVRVGEKCVQQ